ncbi:MULTISPECIES: energy transducer TonB [Myxococcaceae]|uniref:energy transducer TonB n=1 Tax=Myxococcaceae TaxID=31 RepID=UPI00188F7811|nr:MULTISPECIES: energy transducer TonB [Myxococcaceae]MBF5045480.1 energy transducer TonB [Simulacricoccus sp. 17bor-14]
MRPLHVLSGLLLLTAACSHAPKQRALPSDPEVPYVERVREALRARREELHACAATARGQATPDAALITSPLYVSPLFAYVPRSSRSPFLKAFEQCVVERLRSQPPPAPTGEYAAAWVRFQFAAGGQQPVLEVSGTAPERVNAELQPGTLPDPARDVFAYSKEVSVRHLSGEPIRYTQEAMVRGVEGVMVVKCVVTWTGTLEDCRIVKPLAYMEEPVLRSLATTRFAPATFEGTPINVDYTLTIQLRLTRGTPP